ncbi:DNA helicase B [Suncus etruscus]|uniref:DNA helicase B n=1 Tax=Suncus etruscus TaxID=109475 RepID=UPI002110C50F|nr:DNA helicase B [Suncus etruscus]
MACKSQSSRQLLGPLLPPKDVEEEDIEYLKEDEEEEEDDSAFVDAEELCSGGVVAGSLPGRLHVKIIDENTQENCDVFGRFPMTNPWWRVKVHVKPLGKKNYQTQGFPSYFLQYDMAPPNQEHICSLFLKDCNVSAENRNKFSVWINEVSSYKNLNFGNLRETLRTFQKEMERKEQKQSKQRNQEELPLDSEMNFMVENKIPFMIVMTALQFPKIMEFLPILLPRHFKWLIRSGSEDVLETIEEILTTNPWKLGFSKLTYKELNLLRCEASWTAFSQCESLLALMTDLEKNALIIYSKLKQLCREYGHTYVEVTDLTSLLSEFMFFPDACQSLKFMKDIGVVTYEKSYVFLSDLYQAEKDIAISIGDLMTRPSWHLHIDVEKVLTSIHPTKPEDPISNDTLNENQPDESRLEDSVHILDTQNSRDHLWDDTENKVTAEISEVPLDRDQVTALEMICSNAVTVISGKGGCGKTTIVSHLFKHIEQLEESEVEKACKDFEQDQDVPEEWMDFTDENLMKTERAIEVLLTAPTGKAAGLLRQKTGLHAYTLCQVNYSFYLWKTKVGIKDNNKPWKFASVRVLVMDEGSLVSVRIFKSVLNLLCEHSKLSKLIILGDIRQLPSIEPGNLLKDLFETLKPRHCAIELKTNHRAESELIVDNATRISRRQFPKFDAKLEISDNPIFPVSIEDKTFIFVRLPEEDACSQPSKSNHCSYLYSAVTTLLKENDLQNAETSQFIAFRRQDCDVINACCCKHYTGHLIKDHRNRFVFGVGDKICCTKNAYLSDVLPRETSSSQQNNELEPSGKDFHDLPSGFAKHKLNFESGIRLCNGEIFFITKDVTDVTFGRKRYLTINNMAGLEVTVDFDKLMHHCQIKHAWARTIHTFQGSEEHTVVYVVGWAGRQHWQHVYTAVTRGRRRVYVIAEESQLRSAIARNIIPRKTRLKYFLQSQLSDTNASAATGPASLSRNSEDNGEPRSTGHYGEPRSTQPPASQPPSTPPSASPFAFTACDLGTSNIPGSSVADDELFLSPEEWKQLLSSETGSDEDPVNSRGSKRTGGANDGESPHKIQMVEESPHVSSKLQNLRLNSLTPRQLFKPTNNQKT